MTRFWAAVFALFATFIAAPAAAHTRSESHSSWLVDGSSVHLSFSVADIEARRITKDGRPPNGRELIAYLAPLVGASAGGAACTPAAPPHVMAAATGYQRVEFSFACPSKDDIVLRSAAFFDLVPTHMNLAQIQGANGDFVEQVLTTDHREVAMGAEGATLEGAGFLTFIGMGIMHIFTGIDHMSFLVGLVLISRKLRDLAFVVTGFTLGHSLTLALAVTGVIRPHAEFIDALVALTIALIGAENIAVATGRATLVALWTGGALLAMTALRLAGIGLLPPMLLFGAALFASNYLMVSGHLRDAGRVRLVVTLVFGLIHGFGFAADLLESQIPATRLAELLVGFNLGVEIGQLTIVLLLSLATYLLVRAKLALPRPIVVDVAASALVGIGVYWFVGRSFI
ncbi:MAG: HupE/UreJ family protein [Sphingomonas bacterium]|uniref:HupE/UreJ family protein n=1 Tax=Sphingomonas bacterium TaxID=1895847 RepID=UPI00261738F7|nr:HupE/UreJ family protein [Sphingomonas bacterium]MDB5702942.1 HupE/UreJ family protein [Sphingomonas bacterium]